MTQSDMRHSDPEPDAAARTARRRAAYAAAVVLSLVTFTPLVIPTGVTTPWLFGMPRTLWAGILVTAALVVATYFAGRNAPSDLDDTEDESELAGGARPRS